MDTLPAPTPVSESTRIGALDFLRGVAVLAILLVNINSMALPGSAFNNPHLWQHRTAWDMLVFQLNYLFVQQKFITLFCLLFGVGLAMQSERLGGSMAVLGRRVGFLAALGIVHGVFLWYGDVLLWYALLAVPLFFLLKLPARYLIPVALAVWLLPALCCLPPIHAFADTSERTLPSDFQFAVEGRSMMDRWSVMFQEDRKGLATQAVFLRDEGYLPILAFRAVYFAEFAGFGIFVLGWPLLGYMLVGVALMRIGLFARPAEHRGLILRFLAAAVLFGFLPTLWATLYLVPQATTGAYLNSFAVLHFASPAMMLGIVGLLLLLHDTRAGYLLATPLRACGRMALTNYLMPSLLLVPIFLGYGGGFFGKFGYAQLLGFVAAMWLFQIVFSVLWLRWFRFGPLEWLWRCFTYWEQQPLRR